MSNIDSNSFWKSNDNGSRLRKHYIAVKMSVLATIVLSVIMIIGVNSSDVVVNSVDSLDDDLDVKPPFSALIITTNNKAEEIVSNSNESDEDDNEDEGTGDDDLLRRRKPWQGCLKKAAKLCIKACKDAYKDACSYHSCKHNLKKNLKKECKINCKDRFAS